jgi:antirestriction protein ArdC
MKAEQAKRLADTGIANLAVALEQGKSDTLTAYLTTMAMFHRYSFGNVMLIMTQKPEASRIAGFRTWKKLGRYVKKGEKGITIIAPMMIRKQAATSVASSDDDRILRFRTAHVFDLSQTEGEPLSEFASVGGNPNDHTERIKDLITDRGIELAYVADCETGVELGGADGASCGGRIILREDLAPANEFSVLVHELAHEMLHRSEDRRTLSKTVRETEAEAVAFVVSEAIGLDTNTAATDYIQLYAGDRETLAGSLDRIQKTASAIISASMPDCDSRESGTTSTANAA